MNKSNRMLSPEERELYQRNILLGGVGEEGQIALLESRVLIVGLGGLGSSALFYLAASGVGEIGIVDGERVDLSNLQRQILHGRGDVGREKVISAKETISRLTPEVSLKLYPFEMTQENGAGILSCYDFIIEATDNFESKFLINDLCLRMGKPFSHAGILGTYGQTMTVVPGAGPCFRCVFEEVPISGSVETTDEAGVLGTVAGLMGIIQATEALKFLLGLGKLLTGRLLTWDALTMTFREIPLPQPASCPLCKRYNDSGGAGSMQNRRDCEGRHGT